MANVKKRYNPEEKMMILRELLENKVPLSDLAEKYKILYRFK
jgi:transposase-like protein